MNDLVSIIIPVYRVEAYLDRCVKSVLAQSYSDIEIILVDDGSPDGCPALCDGWAERDTRIRVFHKPNGGLSDARNYGVLHARGQYITFLDSDDYLASDCISYLVEMIKSENADIAVTGMSWTEQDTAAFDTDTTLSDKTVLSGREACCRLLSDLYLLLVTACGKLYRSDVVKAFPFPYGKKHEDEATTCKFYYTAEKVVVGNRKLYAYYQNGASITHTQGDRFNEDAAWALSHRVSFFEKQKEEELMKMALTFLVRFYFFDSLRYHGRSDAEIKPFLKDHRLSRYMRAKLRFYQLFPRLYRAIYRKKYKK